MYKVMQRMSPRDPWIDVESELVADEDRKEVQNVFNDIAWNQLGWSKFKLVQVVATRENYGQENDTSPTRESDC